MRRIQEARDLWDFIGYVVLCAPNAFPQRDYLAPEEQMNLERAFEEMRIGLDVFSPRKLTDTKREKALSLLEESLNSYRTGEEVKGAHVLQDFGFVIFNKR